MWQILPHRQTVHNGGMTTRDPSADAGPEEQGDDAPLGLRERRRRATRRDVADAALDLFERHGVHGTTVDDIAQAAGISPRTFFRYAATKEHAVLQDDEEFEPLLRRVREGVAAGQPPAAAIEAAWLHVLDDFDSAPAAQHARALRVRRLIFAEPSVLALALATEAERVDALAAVVMAAPGVGELQARTAVTAVGTVVRLAFDEWARHAALGEDASVRALYDEIRRGFVASLSAP